MHPFEIVSQQYQTAALMVSLLSVWVLVGLFYYLNRFTRRQYFTVWTAAWLFYALWLTLCLVYPGDGAKLTKMYDIGFMLKQWCISISAVFLLWGSLEFLGLPTRQTLFGLFMLFLMVWTFVSPQVFNDVVKIEMPVFMLTGMGSVFAAACFYRARKQMPYVGAGMLSLGFFLWGLYLATYPASQKDENLRAAGFFVAAVLQLFIAVSMIVLVLEEVRYKTEKMRAEMDAVRTEKDALQTKVLTAEEQCRSLYDQVRLTEGTQKAYDELRRTQGQIVQQERLRALGQMASGVAHDINNALSPISAYADLLLLSAPALQLPENARRYLLTIQRCGADIAHIVSRMREFYRPHNDADKLVKVSFNSIIDETMEMTRPRWRDQAQRQGVSIHIERDLDKELPPLLGDPSELREALTNLIFNAVDALPQGGVITLRTRYVARPKVTAQWAARPQIVVEVRDNGMGMDEQTRQRCIEPFFSTKAQRGGTGLGLAMVYGMMQRHEGGLEIESAVGAGACFRMIFPVTEKAAAAIRESQAATESTRSLNVLCVDDEPSIRELLNDCLGQFNHRVSLAATGAEGLEKFRQAYVNFEPFSAVITDLGMPEMDGKQLAKSIKAQSPRTPVIMMTGWGTVIGDGAETMDVDALIGKPPQLQELNNLLLRLCNRPTLASVPSEPL